MIFDVGRALARLFLIYQQRNRILYCDALAIWQITHYTRGRARCTNISSRDASRAHANVVIKWRECINNPRVDMLVKNCRRFVGFFHSRHETPAASVHVFGMGDEKMNKYVRTCGAERVCCCCCFGRKNQCGRLIALMDARHRNVCGIDTQLLISHEKASDVEMMKSARRRRAPAALQNTHTTSQRAWTKRSCVAGYTAMTCTGVADF